MAEKRVGIRELKAQLSEYSRFSAKNCFQKKHAASPIGTWSLFRRIIFQA
jgi:hypothetical protein